MKSQKKRKIEPKSMTETCIGLLDILQDNDSLRSVLLQTSAKDHNNLRQTCRRVRYILDSLIFAQERCEQGFAELYVELTNPWDMYVKSEGLGEKDDKELSPTDSNYIEYYNDLGSIGEYGEVNCDAKILVDGKEAGTIKMCLLSLPSRYNFHYVGDSISRELQKISWLFFTARGRPSRICSVKNAYKKDRDIYFHSEDKFLYISSFELQPPFRTTSIIGAQAIRQLLQETKLAYRWSLAMYIPWGFNEMTKKEIKSPKYEEIFDTKIVQDMRRFLRAGFAQVKETVFDTDCYHVFCVPSLLDEEMLSNDTTLSIPIKTRPTPMSEDARKMIQYVAFSCTTRQEYLKNIKSWQIPVFENPVFAQTTNEFRKLETELQDSEAMLQRSANYGAHSTAMLNLSRTKFQSIRDAIEEKRQNAVQLLEQCANAEIEKIEKEMVQFDTNLRSKLVQAIDESGHDIIQTQFVLHTFASNLMPSYVEMAIELMPFEKRKQGVNGLDEHKLTPLMLAAGSFSDGKKEQVETCRQLLNLGADKDILDDKGVTALGHFRNKQRSLSDTSISYVSSIANFQESEERHSQQMHALLMPSNGPSKADDSYLLNETTDSEIDDFMGEEDVNSDEEFLDEEDLDGEN